MRKALSLLALLAPCACGARTIGDWPAPGSGGSPSDSSGASGGFVPVAGTAGARAPTGGRSSGGSPSLGGIPASDGIASGGIASGGIASGGIASGGIASGGIASGATGSGALGSAGAEPCFEATQPSQGLCIHVRLCPKVQYETLCLLDTPTTAVCFCYVDGVVMSAASIQGAGYGSLCERAVTTHCP